jgi:hypothetical protein
MPEEIETEEGKKAYGERGIKIVFIEDWIDANLFLGRYWVNGNRNYVKKATEKFIDLWLNMSGQFTEKELKGKNYSDIIKLEYFIEHRDKIPKAALLFKISHQFGRKFKKLGITDIGMTNIPNIKTDFLRSW